MPDQVKGLAIGGISLIGEAPDIYLPLIRGALVDGIPGRWGYGIYSLAIASGAPPQQEPAKVLTAWNAT